MLLNMYKYLTRKQTSDQTILNGLAFSWNFDYQLPTKWNLWYKYRRMVLYKTLPFSKSDWSWNNETWLDQQHNRTRNISRSQTFMFKWKKTGVKIGFRNRSRNNFIWWNNVFLSGKLGPLHLCFENSFKFIQNSPFGTWQFITL